MQSTRSVSVILQLMALALNLVIQRSDAFQSISTISSFTSSSSRVNAPGPLNLMDSLTTSSIIDGTTKTIGNLATTTIATSAADSSVASSFLTNTDFWVFIAGVFPFAWATVEFWRRIAVGESFGTGSDSVIIGEDNNPQSSRGRRVLGKDALIVAYFLFGISAAVIALVLYTVVTNEAPPAEFISAATAAADSS